MTQLNLMINSLPRELSEFVFFIIVGFTAGSLGLVWNSLKKYLNSTNVYLNFL